ncbi:STAS domain-containing protein [Acidiphilium sp.]|uniref:STAS domain-containing protein n=1 Tax=Acidiphilium sp. TaxID=527 RepID=UPI003D011864
MPNDANTSVLASMLDEHGEELLAAWVTILTATGGTGGGRIKEIELRIQCQDVLTALRQAVAPGGPAEVESPAFTRVRTLLGEVSRSRALLGFSPTETAMFVFSLKQPLFERLRRKHADDALMIADESWKIMQLFDQLGLYTTEMYQKSREAVVVRQQQEIVELSTPVVKLWEGILALPLIGTLDSVRTQVVMESLLQAIVDQNAEIAIIDITGVPTVDTLVAQHLLKTIAAARLMGADCIVSGIRPQIAQTMVHLGVALNVVSKASLADALALALQRTGRTVVRSSSVTATLPARD